MSALDRECSYGVHAMQDVRTGCFRMTMFVRGRATAEMFVRGAPGDKCSYGVDPVNSMTVIPQSGNVRTGLTQPP